MIFDHHTHVWPYLGDERYGSLASRMLGVKRSLPYDTQGVRRMSDHSRVDNPLPTMYKAEGTGVSALREDVHVVPEDFGRLAWEADGETYYVQWLAPDMQRMEAPADLMIAHMNDVGVTMGLLSCGQTYGKLNDFLAEVVASHQDRFVSCCEVEEWRAYEDSELEELTRSVETLGHRGLFFDDRQAFRVDYRQRYDSSNFVPFWDEVQRLEVVVVWDLRLRDAQTITDFDNEIRTFCRFAQSRADIPFVIAHGFNMARFSNGELSSGMLDLCRLPNVHVEILFPLMNGHVWEYPFEPALDVLRILHSELGGEKLLWGSDMPAVLRVCTYRQALEYLTKHATFIPPNDMQLILGGNAARLYRLSTVGQ